MKKMFLFAALAFSLNGFAQKVNGKLGLKKGQKLEVITETNRNTSQEVMGQTMESKMTSTMTEVYDVQEAGNNGAAVEHKVKRFQFSADGGNGQSQSFDSEKPEDLKGEIGQLLDKKLMKNKYTVMIDAFGKVTGVKLDDDNAKAQKKSEEEGGMAAMMAQQLGASFDAPKMGDPTMFSVLPSKEVGAGDTWSDSTSREGVKNKKIYTVKSVGKDEIVVDFTSDTKVEKTMSIMGTDATISSTDKGVGTITFDRNSKVIKMMTTNNKTEGSVEAQGMTIPVTANGITTVTVKSM